MMRIIGFAVVLAVCALSLLSVTITAQSPRLTPPSQHSMLDMTFPEFEAAIARTDVY